MRINMFISTIAFIINLNLLVIITVRGENYIS